VAEEPKAGHLVWLGVFAGALLFIIGVRFLLVPYGAIFTFGLGGAPDGPALHYVIGLRDLWLGALAVAFALLREWRALGLWFLMGTLVCWADAFIVATNNGPGLAVAFHIGAGIFCLAVGLAAWRHRPRGQKLG
jgi:Domain of unknown function (DUF4267)